MARNLHKPRGRGGVRQGLAHRGQFASRSLLQQSIESMIFEYRQRLNLVEERSEWSYTTAERGDFASKGGIGHRSKRPNDVPMSKPKKIRFVFARSAACSTRFVDLRSVHLGWLSSTTLAYRLLTCAATRQLQPQQYSPSSSSTNTDCGADDVDGTDRRRDRTGTAHKLALDDTYIVPEQIGVASHLSL